MNKSIISKRPEIVELDKKIEDYYNLIRKGVNVSMNNKKIEECIKEKCKYYCAN